MSDARVKAANAVSRLVTSRGDVPNSDCYAYLRCGGTGIYADTEERLWHGIDILERLLCELTTTYLLLSRASLEKQVRDYLNIALSKTLFGAILGRLRRRGLIDAMVGITNGNKPFYSYFNTRRTGEIDKALTGIAEKLQQTDTLSVKQVQVHFFPSKPWGSYSAASALLGAVAWSGAAVQVDKDIFAWPREVLDAMR